MQASFRFPHEDLVYVNGRPATVHAACCNHASPTQRFPAYSNASPSYPPSSNRRYSRVSSVCFFQWGRPVHTPSECVSIHTASPRIHARVVCCLEFCFLPSLSPHLSLHLSIHECCSASRYQPVSLSICLHFSVTFSSSTSLFSSLVFLSQRPIVILLLCHLLSLSFVSAAISTSSCFISVDPSRHPFHPA